MVVAEAPGEVEARIGRPLVGPSGIAFNWYLSRVGLHSSQFYLDNVVQLYQGGNPDPTPELIDQWTPVLQSTIAQVQPRVIITLGRFAARWFLGPDTDMDACRGIPHYGGEFAASGEQDEYRSRARGAIIVPSYHTAFGLRRASIRAVINHDIDRAANIIRLVRGNRPDLVHFPRDAYAGKERYDDVTGAELAALLQHTNPDRIGYDTEGDPENPWSVQVSPCPGVAWVLRRSRDDFHVGIAALQQLADRGCVFVVHDASTPRGTGYDTQVSRTCGLELRDAKLRNTMYRAYALRIEPLGLKPLLWRWCGMRQDDYWGMVEDISRVKQIQFLEQVAARKDWPRIPPYVEMQNNGVMKLKKFGKLESRAQLILTDIAKDKRDKEGNPVNTKKRWAMLEPELRAIAHKELGKLPFGTLDDVPLDQAVYYAGRDADGTGRLDVELDNECCRMGVDGVCWTGDHVLPVFEEMQHEGMPASRRAFVDLATTVQRDMHQIQAGLSHEWFGGKPFNPAPNTKDVEELVKRLGITGLKTTKKSKRPSTSMKSLEYLAPRYPALRQIGEWRRRQKVLSTYCLPLIEVADEQIDIESRQLGTSDMFLVHGNIKPVSVETRRLAMEDPSLLNQPIRTEIGRKVRACYMTVPQELDDPDDPNVEVFSGWDFNSQEVRVTAHVTEDRLLCAIMRDPKRKIHMETASRVFGKPIDQIHEINEKVPAKTAFFGMVYGLQGQGLLDLFQSFGLDTWALSDCVALIAEINKIYPGLPATVARVRKETLRTGMVRDLYGHIRYLPNIWSGKRGEVEEAARQAFSHLVQSTAQGLTQNAMVAMRKPIRDLQRAGLAVKFCLQIHDEVMLRSPRWMYGVLNAIMVDCMQNKYGGPGNLRLSVPVLVDGHQHTRWDKLK